MGKKQRYGGLSPRHLRLIRDYLTKLHQSTQQETTAALFVWTYVLVDCANLAVASAAEAGLTNARATVNALTAGLAVLKRKRVGRICDWNAKQPFAALGSTSTPE